MRAADPTASFDLDYWVSMFPYSKYGLPGTHGPSSVALIEQIRRNAGGPAVLGPSVPTDFFVLGKGEPDNRDVTKVGGIPYRPAHVQWPTNEKGEPMTFLAQFQFAPSKDIIGPTPADVLLIFAAEEYLYCDPEPPFFHFEWYPNGLTDLVEEADTPAPAWEFVKCFGVRHRTVDYVDDKKASTAFENYFVRENIKPLRSRYIVTLYRYLGIKIGGVPFYFDPDDRPAPEINGRFICSIHDISPAYGVPYPWVNVSDPIPFDFQVTGPDVLHWYDGFVINFFLSDQGKVQWYAVIF